MSYLFDNAGSAGSLLLEHLQITVLAIAIALGLAVPLAMLATAVPRVRLPLLGALNIIYTIPSLALIILLVPVFGLSPRSAIAATVLYTQAILVRTLVVAVGDLDPEILEAARGVGMSFWQRWWRVQMPLVLPAFFAGVRLATVVTIAIASLGAKFGAGGLGELLFEGIQQNRSDKIWAGTLLLAVLALGTNVGFVYLQRRLQGRQPRRSR